MSEEPPLYITQEEFDQHRRRQDDHLQAEFDNRRWLILDGRVELRDELRADIYQAKKELRAEIGDLRKELKAESGKVKRDVVGLKKDMGAVNEALGEGRAWFDRNEKTELPSLNADSILYNLTLLISPVLIPVFSPPYPPRSSPPL